MATADGGKESRNTEKKFSALIVDDSPILRRIYKMNLIKRGFTVVEAENGKQAVDLYRSGHFFDLVLMDMEMPVMNGTQYFVNLITSLSKATLEIRALGFSSVIVGATSCTVESKVQEFTRAGLNAQFAKPLGNDTWDAIIQLLNNK
ncbi:hypothetical protein Ancab_023840 [Ancistrocladus abbreviatus]